MPEAGWEENSILGAEKAAKYFLQLYAYVYQTGDLTEWDRLCHPESESCQRVRDDVVALAAASRYYVGGGISIDWVLGQTNDAMEGSYAVEVRAFVDEAIGYQDQVEFDRVPASDYYYVIVPVFTDGAWQVYANESTQLSGESG